MNYSELVNSSTTVLVEFYASWCPHCQRMMPVVAQIKELLAGQVAIHQFDIDEYDKLSQDLGVESLPTFIIYHDGEEMWRQTGEMDGEVLLAKIEKYM